MNALLAVAPEGNVCVRACAERSTADHGPARNAAGTSGGTGVEASLRAVSTLRDLVDWAWDKVTAKEMVVAELGTIVLVRAGDHLSRLR